MEQFCLLGWETIERAIHRDPAGTGWYLLSSQRARVPGGWLVRTIVSETRIEVLNAGPPCGTQMGVGVGQGAGLTFVPDPGHEWALPDPPSGHPEAEL